MRRLLFFLPLVLAAAAPAALPVQPVEIVRRYPHDSAAFTEGLFWRGGRLFESTGLEGRSSLREVRLADGKVLRRRDLPAAVFGEGIVDWGGKLVALEYRSGLGSLWRLADFKRIGGFRYPPEGWGLTRDARRIIMSDGSARLRFLDPATLRQTGSLAVTADGKPVDKLNELEWIDGELWANVWTTPLIARIDPATGRVKGWVDLSPVLAALKEYRGQLDVPNGIAWDRAGRRIFVTGKLWPALYEVRLAKPAPPSSRR